MSKNIDILADFLAQTFQIEKEGLSSEEVIELAVDKLKANAQLDKDDVEDIKDDIEQVIDEEEIYGANTVPSFIDYSKQQLCQDQIDRMAVLKKRLNGVASVKDWAELNLLANPKMAAQSTDEEFDYVQLADDEFDDQNDITYNDIDNFLADLSVGEYIDLYEPEDFDDEEFYDIDDDEDDLEELEREYAELEQKIKAAREARQLTEALTQAERIKRSLAMKRHKALIAMKRRIAMKKHATPEQLEKRARKLAIKMLKKRFAKKDADEMSFSEKSRVEKLIADRKPLVDRLERKMLPVVRQIERERFKAKAS